MVWTVGVLAVLSVIGGWIQFAPLWTPLTTWLAPVAEPFAEATSWEEGIASAAAVALGLAGIFVAHALYVTGRLRVPRPWKVLERKFYWDEAYDVVFYRTADLLARALGRYVEQPIVAGSIEEIEEGVHFGAVEVSRAQNGLVRVYALALASGVAVLAVVFLTTR
jgi:NADH:ubiquinone oxidoreductase subunit 5 (subunit L)/multisubunit Na+/H+ antiporter MnhA subunit